jgi:sodium transport system ATP-binding protein
LAKHGAAVSGQQAVIRIENLVKVFEDRKRGQIRAVDGVSFDVWKGEIFGLLGTNGAGKTTMLRMLATILTPTEGRAEVAGFDVQRDPHRVRGSIGFLTGDTNLYARLTPREILAYYAGLFGMGKEEMGNRIDELAKRFELTEFLDSKVGKLSTGQRQRTSICRSIIQNPDLMIFDEPTAGLDPIGARHITDFIRESRGTGRTVLFSTHYLREAEKLCDRIAIMDHGRVHAVGTLDEILRSTKTEDLEEAFFSLVDTDVALT